MTHLPDTSAMLAHYLAEPGAARVQGLFEDTAVVAGTSILALFELDLRLHQLGIDAATRTAELNRYRALLSEVVNVDEVIRSEAVRLRISATARRLYCALRFEQFHRHWREQCWRGALACAHTSAHSKRPR
jgi:hypothetical protein